MVKFLFLIETSAATKMDDDIDFESDGEHEHTYRYGRPEKRRNHDFENEVEEDAEVDEVEESDQQRSLGQRRTAGASSSSSRHIFGGDDHDDEEDHQPTFKPETIQAIFKGVWTDPGTKAQKEAMQLSAEFLRLFTIEALHRTAAYQREQEDEELRSEETLIELDSLEAITPQLVMDF
ncbi:hypothetical protein BGX28_002607 [Mortierella sp. GBA30]|nr:hypothetical protein BGX28_002607 [Mortierella sp. GBA30]